ncbi:hypothetical protein EAG_10917 [Camponotus floridanus]|uniref:Uncharacterized protein n=1 Tax=Camponotus floridanus TaxID=104421 RepID=E2ALQ1_CAMFO|nr:hypothetical protein EAG_10917 [Camponotus floridanus]
MAFTSLDGVAITADNAAVSTDGIHMPRASVALLALERYYNIPNCTNLAIVTVATVPELHAASQKIFHIVSGTSVRNTIFLRLSNSSLSFLLLHRSKFTQPSKLIRLWSQWIAQLIRKFKYRRAFKLGRSYPSLSKYIENKSHVIKSCKFRQSLYPMPTSYHDFSGATLRWIGNHFDKRKISSSWGFMARLSSTYINIGDCSICQNGTISDCADSQKCGLTRDCGIPREIPGRLKPK